MKPGPAPKIPDEAILALLYDGLSLYAVELALGVEKGRLYHRACVRDRRRFRPCETMERGNAQ